MPLFTSRTWVDPQKEILQYFSQAFYSKHSWHWLYGYKSSIYLLQRIDLRVCGCKVADIIKVPSTQHERSERRRILMVSEIQEGNILKTFFLTVKSSAPQENTFKSEANDYLDISCLLYTSQTFSVRFMITSIDTIRIIEFLLGNNEMSPKLKWKERGRIRSNLAPFWHKPSSLVSTQYRTEPDHYLQRLQILEYNLCKTHSTFRRLRIMLWGDLEQAMHKAILFYYICLPEKFVIYT